MVLADLPEWLLMQRSSLRSMACPALIQQNKSDHPDCAHTQQRQNTCERVQRKIQEKSQQQNRQHGDDEDKKRPRVLLFPAQHRRLIRIAVLAGAGHWPVPPFAKRNLRCALLLLSYTCTNHGCWRVGRVFLKHSFGVE